jgi:hypothetical protein
VRRRRSSIGDVRRLYYIGALEMKFEQVANVTDSGWLNRAAARIVAKSYPSFGRVADDQGGQGGEERPLGINRIQVDPQLPRSGESCL